MAISAVRFETLDQEMNVAVADFLSGLDSSILNSPNLKFLNIPQELSSLVNIDLKDFDLNTLKGIKAAYDETVRKATGLLGRVKDLSKISQKDIIGAVTDLFPNTPAGRDAAAAFKSLALKCATKGFKTKEINAKPYDFDIKGCNSGNKKTKKKGCAGAAGTGINNVFSKLSGGTYGSLVSDYNEVASNLVNLGSMGYDAELCGVFNTLTAGLDLPDLLLNRIGASLLEYIAANGNIAGFFDLAKGTQGLDVLKEAPGAITQLFENFQMPASVTQNDYVSFSQSLSGSMELLDPQYNVAQDGLASIGYSQYFNDDISEVFTAEEQSTSAFSDIWDMDEPCGVDSTYTNSAFSAAADASEDFFDFEDLW